MKIYKEQPNKYGWYRTVKYRSTTKDFVFTMQSIRKEITTKPKFWCDTKFMRDLYAFFEKEINK